MTQELMQLQNFLKSVDETGATIEGCDFFTKIAALALHRATGVNRQYGIRSSAI